jgi:predicted DNA-binding transcriptional regulator YafY
MSNTATRLITLIMLLQRRPNQKAGDLAEALGVSVRSLHRYIGMLEEMGIPVYSERGPAGGFSLVRGYKMPPLVFTPAEAVSVALGAGLVGELWGPLYAEAAQGALAKLDNVLPDEQRREVEWAMQSLVATGVNKAAACTWSIAAAAAPASASAALTSMPLPTAMAGGTPSATVICVTKCARFASTAW